MKIKTIYVFGDSLHDNGNLYESTNQVLPSSNYYNGRFSNGPVYCEYVSSILSEQTGQKVELKNFAYGGALTNDKNGYEPKAVSLKEQLELENFSFNENDLIVLGCGPNNFAFFFDIYKFPFLHLKRLKSVANDIECCIKKTIEKGAKNILVFNIPDIFMAPVKKKLNFLFRKLVYPFVLKYLDKANKNLKCFVDSTDKNGANILLFDINSIYTDALLYPEKYGFKNSNLSVIPGMGKYGGEIPKFKKPDEYLFWDYVHPSTKAHKMVGEHIVDLLNQKFSIE